MVGVDGLRRGEIWLYQFAAPDKRRPVVILSRARALRLLRTVVVAQITSTIRGIPSEVVVGPDEGLKTASAINLDHIQTVDKHRLHNYVGTLSEDKMQQVCRALAIATGCA